MNRVIRLALVLAAAAATALSRIWSCWSAGGRDRATWSTAVDKLTPWIIAFSPDAT